MGKTQVRVDVHWRVTCGVGCSLSIIDARKQYRKGLKYHRRGFLYLLWGSKKLRNGGRTWAAVAHMMPGLTKSVFFLFVEPKAYSS